ncbi:hypothetical protein FRC98_11185 [Lujinxingia vulgaris]|uniref:Uncharacterized protein n=1 Tax=Lujinxingia vulgaris TaxID=2600176 RepID=A0A5C6XA68_9DELT|nr:hypothetical protein [Lujinxingia vulgaris]TXD37286.1 hypothetical protein FRC98_11185 [Lujinxingia vulgaris]
MSSSHNAPLALLLLTLSAVLAGCPPSSPGEMTNLIADDLSFVTDDDLIYVHHRTGLDQIRVNGTDEVSIYGEGYSFQDVTDDAGLWALGDSQTNLYLLDAPGAEPERIPELDGRTSAVAIHPEGTLVAATRHADFDLPQDRQVDDDAIYLIDPTTLDVNVLPATSNAWLFQLYWSEDGTTLYGSGHEGNFRIDPATNTREPIASIPAQGVRRPRLSRDICEATGERLETDDEGIWRLTADGTREPLVTIEGRERGFHDYASTINGASYTRSCDYVVFVFQDTVWVAEVATGLVGRLREGQSVRLIEPAAPEG